ncbi:MAG: hypothetical protein ABII25_06150 [bacterium]
MKLNRNYVILKKMTKEDDSYAAISPQERVSVMWDITAEIWSLRDKKSVKQRLRRNVTNLIKQ